MNDWQDALLSPKAVADIIQVSGAFLEGGHFILSSGRHSDSYLAREILMEDHNLSHFERLCRAQAAGLCQVEQDLDRSFDFITGPAAGGMVIARRVQDHLRDLTGRDMPLIATVKDEREGRTGEFTVDAYVEDLNNLRGVMFEDVVTSGGSCQRAAAPFRAAGAEIMALLAFFNREGKTAESLGFPVFRPLLDRRAVSYDVPTRGEAACPLCMALVPPNEDPRFGRGAKYVAERRAQLESGN